MNAAEWLACDEPELLLEHVEGKTSRANLVEFVRRCWASVREHVPPTDLTAAEEFAAVATKLSDHDAVVYAAEAALKAARWAPDIKAETRHQANVFRAIFRRPG